MSTEEGGEAEEAAVDTATSSGAASSSCAEANQFHVHEPSLTQQLEDVMEEGNSDEDLFVVGNSEEGNSDEGNSEEEIATGNKSCVVRSSSEPIVLRGETQ